MRTINTKINTIIQGNSLEVLKDFPDGSIDCVISSPPYWQLRDYGWKKQWGLEKTYQEYLENLWMLMKEIHRILKPEGTVWINIGDTYFGSGNGSGKKAESIREINNLKNADVYPSKANDSKENGLKKKTLSLIPHRFAIGCIERGWIVRNDIIWAKPNSLPESAKDRFGKKHEHIFLLTKSTNYFFDLDAIRDPYKDSSKERAKYEVTAFGGDENSSKAPLGKSAKSGSKQKKMNLNPLGKNPGDVTDFWVIANKHNSENHYAAYNKEIITKPILAGCPIGGIVLDPFCGTGTTGVRAIELRRNFVGIDGSKEYCDISRRKLNEVLKLKTTTGLNGKLSNEEVAEKLREQADVLQKYIDAKLNPAISKQRPTARRIKILSSMKKDAFKMERLQNILRALANAHQSNSILHFPHLEDIRNKKQIETLLLIEEIQKHQWDISKWVDSEQDTLERMSIFSEFDWKNAYKELQKLLEENKKNDKPMENDSMESTTEMKLLELEAIAELELLKLELKENNNLEGNEKPISKPYQVNSQELITQEEYEKKVKKDKPVPEIKLTYSSDSSLPNLKITKSQDAEIFLREIYETDTIELHEQFIVLYLNRANRIIGYNRHSKGGLTGTVADLRIIFSAALKSLATGIIVSHNHPSGNLNPSDADIRLTNRINETGKIIDIPLLDHIILTKEGFYSFTDNGHI